MPRQWRRHAESSPGCVHYRDNTGDHWQARVYCSFYDVYLGTFEAAGRAQVAVGLFKHWVKLGFDPKTIPTRPRTKDAI